jgi:uncharacterized protein (TIGR01777 family)
VQLTYRSYVDVSAEEAFAWHARPGALERLVPPWQRVRVLERSGGIEDGARVVMEVGPRPLARRWVAVHSGYREGREFRDEQVQGPFARWVHVHRFVPEGDDACALEDEVDFELPGGALGRTLGGRAAFAALQRMFHFRHARVRRDLERHARVRDAGPRRVVVSGASGLVGSSLVPFLTTGGHRVERLVRRSPRGDDEIGWDPARQKIDARRLEGADAVVHLAGESVAAGRWTGARKASILGSRVEGTRLLCEALAALERPPGVLIAASAIGFYGDAGDAWVDESSPPGRGFLADVCAQWEAATQPASAAGIRVVNLRIGIAVAASGGALARLLAPFRLGAGGRVGDGRQFMSWIALDDLIGAIHFAIFDPSLHGPVNAVAPAPVRNAEFTRTLGRVLRRPAALPLPAAAVRALLGEMGQEVLLAGARVRPAKLDGSGFRFLFPSLEAALRSELGRR